MVSCRTENRKRKVTLLRESLNDITDLLLLEHKYRDWINMKHFKELAQKVKDMKKIANSGQKDLLKDSKISV